MNTRSVKKSQSLKRTKQKSYGFNSKDTSDRMDDSTTTMENSFNNVNKSQISEYFEHEKQDLPSIPLYRLLKLYNLQQYARELISRGFGYRIEKLCRLNRNELNELMAHIKVMPGHRLKLYKLVDYIRTIIPDIMIDPKKKRRSQQSIKATPTKKQTNSYQGYQRKKNSKPKTALRPGSAKKRKGNKRNKTASKKRQVRRFKKIGMDYFDDQNQNLYDQFQDTMDHLMYQYQQNPKQYQTQSTIKTDKMQTKPQGFYNKSQSKKERKSQFNKKSSLPNFYKNEQYFHGGRIKSLPQSTKNQKTLSQAHSEPYIGREVELIPENYSNQQQYQMAKDQFGVSMVSRKVDFTDSDLMKQEISELVHMLNKDPDARISIDLLKCLSPDVRSQLLNSNLINNISEINTAYNNKNHNVNKIRTRVQQKLDKQQVEYQQYYEMEQQQQLLLQQQQQLQQQQLQQEEHQQGQYFEEEEDDSFQIEDHEDEDEQYVEEDIQKEQYYQQQQQQQYGPQQQLGPQQQQQQEKSKGQPLPKELTEEQKELRKSIQEKVTNIQMLKNKIAKKLNKDKDGISEKEGIKFPKLQLEKAKDLFNSYDGSKMTSTIVNIDIEEISFCLACAIQKHIEYFQRSYEEGLIEEYSTAYGQELSQVPNPQQTNQNKKLLIDRSQRSLKQIKEVREFNNNEKEKENNSQHEGFKFNNVSDMDKSGDKSSTRYDAKFIEDDEMNYDPEITNPSNQSKLSKEEDEEQMLIQQNEQLLLQQENEQIEEGEELLLLQQQDQEEVYIQDEEEEEIMNENYYKQQEQKINEEEDQLDEVNVFESNEQYEDQYENNQMHQLSKISEKTIDYSNHGENEQVGSKREIQEFQKSRDKIETILRESLMGIFQPQTRRSQQITKSQENLKDSLTFLLQSANNKDSVKVDFSYASQYEEDLNDLVKDPLKRYQAKNIFDDCYNDRINIKLMQKALGELPTKRMIQNFCKNILLTAQMEKEIPILSLVYVERLIINSGFYVTSVNWRKIVFASLMVASKIWDDESFENDSFHKAFRSIYTPSEINNMERRLLEFIDYMLFIKASDYAKYYFILRTFAQKNKKSFPLKELDLDRILFLQQNQNKAQQKLREIYSDPLNKTYEF